MSCKHRKLIRQSNGYLCSECNAPIQVVLPPGEIIHEFTFALAIKVRGTASDCEHATREEVRDSLAEHLNDEVDSYFSVSTTDDDDDEVEVEFEIFDYTAEER